MSTKFEGEAYILGGHLRVTVTGRIHPAEPDVGMGECPEIDEIRWANGKPIRDSIWRRMTQKDTDACHDALLRGAEENAEGYADYLYELARDARMEAEWEQRT